MLLKDKIVVIFGGSDAIGSTLVQKPLLKH